MERFIENFRAIKQSSRKQTKKYFVLVRSTKVSDLPRTSSGFFSPQNLLICLPNGLYCPNKQLWGGEKCQCLYHPFITIPYLKTLQFTLFPWHGFGQRESKDSLLRRARGLDHFIAAGIRYITVTSLPHSSHI